jgi:DNA-binding NtrC family response regulator
MENKKNKNIHYGLALKTSNKIRAENILYPKNGHKKCVFTAEDSENLQDDMLNILKKYEHEIVNIHCGNKALETFKQKHFDLFISVLCGMAEIDLLKEIKTIVTETEVMIVTGCETVESYLESISSEAFEDTQTNQNARNEEHKDIVCRYSSFKKGKYRIDH